MIHVIVGLTVGGLVTGAGIVVNSSGLVFVGIMIACVAIAAALGAFA